MTTRVGVTSRPQIVNRPLNAPTSAPRPVAVGGPINAGIRAVEEKILTTMSYENYMDMCPLTSSRSVVFMSDFTSPEWATSDPQATRKLFVIDHDPFAATQIHASADIGGRSLRVCRVNDTHVVIGWSIATGSSFDIVPITWKVALVRITGNTATIGPIASLSGAADYKANAFFSMEAVSTTHALGFQYGHGAFVMLLDVASLTVSFPPSAVAPFTVTGWSGKEVRDSVQLVPDRSQVLTFDSDYLSLFDINNNAPRLLNQQAVAIPRTYWYYPEWVNLGNDMFYVNAFGPADYAATVIKVTLSGNIISHQYNIRGDTESKVLCKMGSGWFLGVDALFSTSYDLGLVRNRVTAAGNLEIPRRYEKTVEVYSRIQAISLANERALVLYAKSWGDNGEPDPNGAVAVVEMFES